MLVADDSELSAAGCCRCPVDVEQHMCRQYMVFAEQSLKTNIHRSKYTNRLQMAHCCVWSSNLTICSCDTI